MNSFKGIVGKHLKENPISKKCRRRPWLEFECEGVELKVSVQASSYHYCTPRDDSTDLYEEVELGFPNFLFSEGFIDKYAEDFKDPKETVYPYVPVDEFEDELDKLFNRSQK